MGAEFWRSLEKLYHFGSRGKRWRLLWKLNRIPKRALRDKDTTAVAIARNVEASLHVAVLSRSILAWSGGGSELCFAAMCMCLSLHCAQHGRLSNLTTRLRGAQHLRGR